MQPHPLVSTRRLSPATAGFALACLLIQLPVQAADTPAANNGNGPVIVSGDPVKPPSKHHQLVRSPAQPHSHPTKPQGQVQRLR